MRSTNEKKSEQKKAMRDKALGPNSIRTKILKVHSKTLSKHLAELINLSLNQGKFPTILRMAKVILIHTGHKILPHKDNRFLLLLFYCKGNDEQFIGTLIPLKG